jgi:hypothetical protein
MRHGTRLVAAGLLLAILSYAIGSFKPARRLFPALLGFTCGEGPVCVEAAASLPLAEGLYSDALHFVNTRLVILEHPRPFLFCTSTGCAKALGLQQSLGQTTGPFGSVIGPKGWAPYIVRHELIHQVQNEQLGVYRVHPGPAWLLEGMAYTLSDDPRPELDSPWQQHRHRFSAWYASFPHEQLWERARNAR